MITMNANRPSTSPLPFTLHVRTLETTRLSANNQPTAERLQKIARLRAMIAAGNYRISSATLAECLVDRMTVRD